MSINKVILVGNLGKDPELRSTPSGVPVATFPVATSERFKDRNGQQQERTEWHNIVAWRQLAEICGKYLHKGKQVYLEGKIQTRKYQDRDGNDRYVTEIVADQMQMLGTVAENQSQQGGRTSQQPAQQPAQQPRGSYQSPPVQHQNGGGYEPSSFPDDDIPFTIMPTWREFVK